MNSYDGIKGNLDKVDLKSYELILMFGINKNLKNKIVVEVKSKYDNKELMTTVNYKKFKLWLHENNIDVDITFKPTRYLCNYAYYLALSNNTNCVFVHIPSLSKFPNLEKLVTIIGAYN